MRYYRGFLDLTPVLGQELGADSMRRLGKSPTAIQPFPSSNMMQSKAIWGCRVNSLFANQRAVAMLLALGLSLLFSASAVAGGIDCDESWRCVLGESTVEYHVGVRPLDPRVTALKWNLIMADRTVVSGEVPLDAQGRGTLKLDVPPVKPTVTLEALLVFKAKSPDDMQQDLLLQKPITIYPREAFPAVDRLRKLGIAVFDPAKTTAEVMVKAGLPITQVRSLETLRTDPAGLLILGEELIPEKYPGLPELMLELLATGKTIICLAPSAGRWRGELLAGIDPNIKSVSFRRGEALTEFDKRFDVTAWSNVAQPLLGGWALESSRGQLTARFAAEPAGWPWIEVRGADRAQANDGGRLIFCGYGLIKHWETGPMPRSLLAALLEEYLKSSPAPLEK